LGRTLRQLNFLTADYPENEHGCVALKKMPECEFDVLSRQLIDVEEHDFFSFFAVQQKGEFSDQGLPPASCNYL